MLGNTFHNVKRPERGFNHFFKQMHKTLKSTVSAMGFSASLAKIIVESLLYFMEINFGVYFRTVNRLTPNDIYESYRTANLQTLHFVYLFNKCRY